MISGTVPFEELVQSIKDETGIENLRPLYERIKRFIFRGEREIGYGGSVSLKKKTYKITTDYNGKYFPFPEDLIEFEGIGQSNILFHGCNYTATTEGIRFKTTQTKNVVLLYWAIDVDDQGYPKVTRNHEEAVIAFIIWKLYTSRVFLGIGNMNAKQDYKQEFTFALLEARGDDAFPTLEQWDDLGALSYTDRRILLEETVHYFDYSENEEECSTSSTTAKVYYWQLENLTETLASIIPSLQNTTYLFSKPNENYEVFEQGKMIAYSNIAKIAFAIYQTSDMNFLINDSLNNDITDEFDTYYAEAISAMVFVSKTHRSYSTLYFKFKKL